MHDSVETSSHEDGAIAWGCKFSVQGGGSLERSTVLNMDPKFCRALGGRNTEPGRIGEKSRIPNIDCITLREEFVIKGGVEDDERLIIVRGNRKTKATIEIFNGRSVTLRLIVFGSSRSFILAGLACAVWRTELKVQYSALESGKKVGK